MFVSFPGPVMTKFTIALREIGTYKEVLRSQVVLFCFRMRLCELLQPILLLALYLDAYQFKLEINSFVFFHGHCCTFYLLCCFLLLQISSSVNIKKARFLKISVILFTYVVWLLLWPVGHDIGMCLIFAPCCHMVIVRIEKRHVILCY
jgi:hypothetical protein